MVYRALIVYAKRNGAVSAQYAKSFQPFDVVQALSVGRGRIYRLFQVTEREEFAAFAEQNKVLRHAQAALRELDAELLVAPGNELPKSTG